MPRSYGMPPHGRGDPSRAEGRGESQPLPLLEVRIDHRRESHPLQEIFQREGAETHLVACRLTERSPRRLLRWLSVELPAERADHLLQALKRRLGSRHLALARLAPGRLLLRVSEPAPGICLATFRAGGICVVCPLLSRRERDPLRVVLARGPRSHEFLKDLSDSGQGRLAIARLRPYRSDATLTPQQNRALRIAHAMGYFDYPRKSSLGEVARALGRGRSATLEVLRRATGKLARDRYGGELGVRTVP